MKISLCMIAKNEEKVIGRAIDSCKDVVDEIILVDTGSEDRTVEIAKRKGAKVHFFAWKNDFAAAKNYALSKAKGDWIVFLDADEYFGNDTGRNLKVILTSVDLHFNAVACKMYNVDSYTKEILDILTHIRIFRNSRHIRYVNSIHEMLQDVRLGKKIQACLVREDDLVLFHTGYSSKDRAIKANRNLEMLLHEIESGVENPAYYHYIADCYVLLENWEKVIEYTRRFWEYDFQFAVYNIKPHQNMIDAMICLRYPVTEVLEEIDKAITQFPQHPQFYFSKGVILLDIRKYDEAQFYLQKSLDLHGKYTGVEFDSVGANLWKINAGLAGIYEHKTDYERAISLYIKSLQEKWDNKPCCDRMLVLLRESPFTEVTAILNSIYNIENEKEIEFLLGRLVNHAMPKVLAYYVIQRQKRFPKDDFIMLQMLVANGYYDKALAALLECCKKDNDERLAIVSAAAVMLSNNLLYATKFYEILPERIVKVMRTYFGENVVLDDEYLIYIEILHVFMLWGSEEQIQKMISLGLNIENTINSYIARAFVDKGSYNFAKEFYKNMIECLGQEGRPVEPEWYFSYGYCLHRVGLAKEAIDNMVKAYHAGYRKNDVFELLRWNQSKLDMNSEIKECVNAILKNKSRE